MATHTNTVKFKKDEATSTDTAGFGTLVGIYAPPEFTGSKISIEVSLNGLYFFPYNHGSDHVRFLICNNAMNEISGVHSLVGWVRLTAYQEGWEQEQEKDVELTLVWKD